MREESKGLNRLIMKWAKTKWGSWSLFTCAFADASFIGVPTPMCFFAVTITNLAKAYRYALIGTIGILCGSIAGYSIGHFAWLDPEGDFTRLAETMFNFVPGLSVDSYNKIQLIFEKWDFLLLFASSFIPVPFMIFAVSSGVFDINILLFCLAIFISQGLRFYLMAFLIVKLGPGFRKFFREKIKSAAIIGMAGIALVFVMIRILS